VDDAHAPRGDGGRVRAVVVLTAAGSGARLGHAVPKALVSVGGVPLVVHALRRLWASGVVRDVVVTVPAEHRPAFEAAVEAAVADAARSGTPVSARCVTGGPTRQASVAAGVQALIGVLPEEAPDDDAAARTVVLVHDAARALTPPEVVRRVADAVAAGADVVVPVVPVTDSVLDVLDGVRPVDRTRLRVAQTPQGFELGLLRRAHAAAAGRAQDEATAATDDAQLCVAQGAEVTLVEGHPDALKVTTPRDLAVAVALVSGPAAAPTAGAGQEPA
jgi:2-C-methyl-D-erythritol 4-phosphate cytidylyltransferase